MEVLLGVIFIFRKVRLLFQWCIIKISLKSNLISAWSAAFSFLVPSASRTVILIFAYATATSLLASSLLRSTRSKQLTATFALIELIPEILFLLELLCFSLDSKTYINYLNYRTNGKATFGWIVIYPPYVTKPYPCQQVRGEWGYRELSTVD